MERIKQAECGKMFAVVEKGQIVRYECDRFNTRPPCHLKVAEAGWIDQDLCKSYSDQEAI